jgi:nitrile hydratase
MLYFKGISGSLGARAVLAEFGLDLPSEVRLVTHDSNTDMRYLVLPEPPADADTAGPAALQARVTRDHLIGVARAV